MDLHYRYFEGQHSQKFVSFKELDKMVQFLVENDVLNYLYDVARAIMGQEEPDACSSIPQVDVVVDAQIVGHINISNLLNSQGYYVGDKTYCPEKGFSCGTVCQKESCPEVRRQRG